jgi:hypothetical protein
VFTEVGSLMQEVVEIQNPTAYSGVGNDQTLGAALSVPAHIQFQRYLDARIPTNSSEGSYTILVPSGTDVTIESRLTLPASYSPRNPRITRVEIVKDEWGVAEFVRVEAS